jgi:hypothetical protein
MMTEKQNDSEKDVTEETVTKPRHFVLNAKAGNYFGKGQEL